MIETSRLNIHVPFPDVASPQLHLVLAACQLNLQPSQGEAWVTGTYDDLAGYLPLKIQQNGSMLIIMQRETLAETLRIKSRLAPLDLMVSGSQPFGLILEGGLLESRVDLSGLPLTRLEVKPGKGSQEVLFNAPNPERIQTMNIRVGAARLELRGLGNANFANLNLDGGQADCLVDFSGGLRYPAQARITIPEGSLEIHVPTETPTRLAIETFGTMNIGEGFKRQGGALLNPAALAGQTPILSIKATVLTGSVRLRSC
ncbi:MAG TPA: hypothetical protein VK897_20825 [Anaerolineales bacterium]|nr:hypothetical protein [Anaerolineales bacterium]